MKILLMTVFAVVVTIVSGCQSMKEDAHRNIDEWVDLAGVGIYWDQVPEDRRRTGVTRFVLGKNKERYQSYSVCEPSPRMWYSRSKESINSPKELFRFVSSLGWAVADCGDGGDRERYQLAHKAKEWALMRWRESGLRLTDQQRADIFCGIDGDLRRYKQHNPGRSVDTDVLDFLKDNPLPNGWECGI